MGEATIEIFVFLEVTSSIARRRVTYPSATILFVSDAAAVARNRASVALGSWE